MINRGIILFTTKEKLQLLEKAQIEKALTLKQLFILVCWESFNRRKINDFYSLLNVGMAAKYAFEKIKFKP